MNRKVMLRYSDSKEIHFTSFRRSKGTLLYHRTHEMPDEIGAIPDLLLTGLARRKFSVSHG